MKVKISLLLCLVLALSAFVVGCSGSGGTQEPPTPAETPDDVNDAVEADPLRVILLIPGTLGDKSFFDAANTGLELVKNELGAVTRVIEMGTDSTRWEPTFLDAIDENWDIIISGNDTTELMNELALEYPDQKFINFDTFIEETPDNVYSMFYSTNEVSYLAGALAGLVTKSDMPLAKPDNKIGFLGGMDIPGINDFLVGYIEGAKYVNPDIKIVISYAGDFTDPAKGKEITLVQYNSGVDISFNVAGGTGLGLIDAASESNAYAIGVDSDQALLFKDSDPKKAEHVISSAVKKIDQAILNAVKSYGEGNLSFGIHQEMGVAEEGVGLAKNEYYETLPEEIKEQLAEIEAKIASGEIKVGTAFGAPTEEIDALRESVRP